MTVAPSKPRRARVHTLLLCASSSTLLSNNGHAAFIPSSLASGRGAFAKTRRNPAPRRCRDVFVASPLSMVSASIPTEPEQMNTTPPPTSPLPPQTFAGQIERALISKFGGEEPIRRVLDSWRYLEMGYEHRQFVGPDQDPPASDPSASACHQHSPSYVPGLTCRQYWDTSDFDWCGKLADAYPRIKEEFSRVTSDADGLSKKGNNIWAGALTDDASGYGTGWRTLVLMDRGRWDPVNVGLFPETSRAVRDCGIPATEAFFASMKPGSDIKLHSDFTNFVLTSHLPLDVPENGSNKCRLTIGDETRQWLEGKVMLFDTSIMHSAVNESEDKTRYILMFRLWHPDLTVPEREALQFIYDALELPELVSDDPGARYLAEQRVELSRTFPEPEGSDGDSGRGAKKSRGEFKVEGLGKKKGGGKKKGKGKRKGGGGGKGFGA